MLRLVFCYILITLTSHSVWSQCNGQTETCSKKYDEVAFLTTHNAFNTGSESFSFPNQNHGIAVQLQNGVRAFMLDIYEFFGNTVQYHGSWTLGSQDIQDDLGEVKSFLDNNPNEVVTLILECYVDASTINSEIDEAGLTPYLFTKIDGQDWPTLQEMIDDNERLVILSDENDANAGQDWYHYMWDHMTETHYSVNSPQDFTDEYNRGDSLNDLFIFNHFVTDATIGVGSESDAIIVNEYDFLMGRIANHFDVHQKFPNFITLDFYEQGDGLAVVEDLNAGFLKNQTIQKTTISIYPNPVTDVLRIKETRTGDGIVVKIIDLNGKVVLVSSSQDIDCSMLEPGLYLVSITDGSEEINHKLVIE